MSRLLYLALLVVALLMFSRQVHMINDGLTGLYGNLEQLGHGVSLERLGDVARSLGR